MKVNDISPYLGYIYVSLAALAYGISTPFSKVFLDVINPLVLSGWFYLFSGLSLLWSFPKSLPSNKESLKRKDIKILIPIIVSGSILAPFFIFIGLRIIPAFQASLYLNFEVVFTILVALVIFRDEITKKAALGIGIVIIVLMFWSINFNVFRVFEAFNFGILFILLGCFGYSIDNNLTESLGNKYAPRITAIKGLFGGLFSLGLSFFLGYQLIFSIGQFILIFIIGILSYGISILFFIKSLQLIGTIKTTTIFSTSPFLGSIFSVLFLSEFFNLIDIIVFFITLIGIYLILSDKHVHYHSHGIVLHTHKIELGDIHHQDIILAHDKTKVAQDEKIQHIHKPKQHKHSHSHYSHHAHEDVEEK